MRILIILSQQITLTFEVLSPCHLVILYRLENVLDKLTVSFAYASSNIAHPRLSTGNLILTKKLIISKPIVVNVSTMLNTDAAQVFNNGFRQQCLLLNYLA